LFEKPWKESALALKEELPANEGAIWIAEPDWIAEAGEGYNSDNRHVLVKVLPEFCK
jgi:hypothetical protein